jgi:calcium-dependent protein kinase
VREFYTFDKLLGKGNFGVVHKVIDKKTGVVYACKSISKKKMTTSEDIEDVRREIQVCRQLGAILDHAIMDVLVTAHSSLLA